MPRPRPGHSSEDDQKAEILRTVWRPHESLQDTAVSNFGHSVRFLCPGGRLRFLQAHRQLRKAARS